MYSVKDFLRPRSLGEALACLAADPEAVLLAGGTDVYVRMRKERPKDVTLVSLSDVPELKGIKELNDGTIEIGAYTTFTSLASEPVIIKKLPMLKTASLAMGGPQIQTMATIGGNICNGAVSADSAPSLFALEAELLLQSAESIRRIPIADFYLGPGKVDRREGELLVKILIPPREELFGGVYKKFATRKAMDLAILGVAAACSVDSEGCITKAAIALGVAAPTPIRCPKAEESLIGQKLAADDAAGTSNLSGAAIEAAELAAVEACPRDSWRASRRYRLALIKELTARALTEAYGEASVRAEVRLPADSPAESAGGGDSHD